jgi:hypothetical protein
MNITKHFIIKTIFCFVLLFRLECKPISADLHPTEDNSTLPFIQYDL